MGGNCLNNFCNRFYDKLKGRVFLFCEIKSVLNKIEKLNANPKRIRTMGEAYMRKIKHLYADNTLLK